ncbi:GNAT family N-acetyltransferase [Streptomyces sp. NPDC015127]|uniref:GNAT family N-acetyltransferase n=1 Tax=Streptomyces sp. NPDC015127 TaxID=3364939 RepID=UPI0036F6E890
MIRNAVPADLDAIAALHAEARASYYRGHLADELFDSPAEHARMRAGWEAGIGRGVVLCAERRGAVVGVAASGEIDGVMNLAQFHVDPARWRAGIGTELHAACLASWRRTGVTTVRLEVFEHNTRAQGFYARQGWLPDPDEPRTGNHLVLRLEIG